MSSFCDNCGHELRSTSKFCGACGTSASENPKPSQFTVKKIRTNVATAGICIMFTGLIILYFPFTEIGAGSWSYSEMNTMCDGTPNSNYVQKTRDAGSCPSVAGTVLSSAFMSIIGIGLIVLSVAKRKTVVI